MRLIDADALLQRVQEEADFPSDEWCKVIECIEEAPTVNEVSTDEPSNCNLCRFCDNGYCSFFDRLFEDDEMYCTAFEERRY